MMSYTTVISRFHCTRYKKPWPYPRLDINQGLQSSYLYSWLNKWSVSDRYSWLKLFDFYSPSSTYLLENPTWTLHRSAYLYSSYSWIYTTDVSLHITGIITSLAEKLNTTIITERHNDGLVSRETAAAIKQAQQENQHFLRIPRRFVSITDLF